MPELPPPLSAETLAWLHQAAAAGVAEPFVMRHLLKRVEALEADVTEQSRSASFCNEAIVQRLQALEAAAAQPVNHVLAATEMAPTPEAAPVATDAELNGLFKGTGMTWQQALRACYNLGRQHGAAQPPASPPAPSAAPADALAARPLLEKMARLGDCIGQQTVAQVRQLAEQAAAWLRAHPPGQPVAIEPRGCPTPGACSCIEPAQPAAPVAPAAPANGESEYTDTEWAEINRWKQEPPAAPPAPVAAPAGGLVERVEACAGGDGRAAIREVAAWLRENYDYREVLGTGWANLIEAIEDEAGQ